MEAIEHRDELKLYRDFRPSGFDTAGLGLENQQDWRVAPCKQNRDSDALTRSNFACQVDAFEKIDPEGADHEVCSFNHWACGWFEVVIVRPGSKVEVAACEVLCGLADYPIVSEDHFSSLEFDEHCDNICGEGCPHCED